MLKTKAQGPKYKIRKASITIMPGNKISIKNHKCLKGLPEQPQRQCSAPADEGASLPAQPAGDGHFLGPKPPRLRPLHSPCPARLRSSLTCAWSLSGLRSPLTPSAFGLWPAFPLHACHKSFKAVAAFMDHGSRSNMELRFLTRRVA